MSDLEEKLNAILSSPETMEQIGALAASLTGSGQPPEKREGEDEASAPAPMGTAGAGLGALLGGLDLDPALLGRLMPLVQEYQSGSEEKQALLAALKPFLKPDRQDKVERAIRIARLSHVIRRSMLLFREDGHV